MNTDSGWPIDLPHPLTVQHAVDVFFSQGRELSAVINEANFRRRLALPSTHPNFPNPSLLHAMLAAAASLVSYDFFEGETYFLPATGCAFHTRKARESIVTELSTVRNMAQVSQTLMIVCHVLCWQGECVTSSSGSILAFLNNANSFVQLWRHLGFTVRLLGPLGLNNLRSPWMEQVQQPCLRPKIDSEQVFYIRPVSLEDHHEAAWVYWRIFVEDRCAALQTSWPFAINEGQFFW